MKTFVVIIALTLTFWVDSAQILTSPLLTNWGTWGEFEHCPPGSKIIKIQVKVERWDAWDMFFDDTCLNAIKFTCGNPNTGEITKMITSTQGQWGNYRNVTDCNGNKYAIGFMLRVEEGNTAFVDETATNNIRILCSASTNGWIEMDGERWGEWTNPRICADHEYMCGLQTQVEEYQGIFGDDTSLNNIRVQCCDLSKEDMILYGMKKDGNVNANLIKKRQV